MVYAILSYSTCFRCLCHHNPLPTRKLLLSILLNTCEIVNVCALVRWQPSTHSMLGFTMEMPQKHPSALPYPQQALCVITRIHWHFKWMPEFLQLFSVFVMLRFHIHGKILITFQRFPTFRASHTRRPNLNKYLFSGWILFVAVATPLLTQSQWKAQPQITTKQPRITTVNRFWCVVLCMWVCVRAPWMSAFLFKLRLFTIYINT